MYNDPYENNAFWTIYMIFGLICIAIFFFGVCALLCCCRTRFRGRERKGYVIGDPAGQSQPLIHPGVSNNQTVVVTGAYPAQPAPYPTHLTDANAHNPPQAPPPYEMPAKY